jgi:hypothetical protein
MNRTVGQTFIQSREKALKTPKYKKKLPESFSKTTTANVPCYSYGQNQQV